MSNQVRNSSHELLRIFAMTVIVGYHLVLYYLYSLPHKNYFDNMYEALLPSLHIGVILFVLISGFYGINPSYKGFMRLLSITFLYYVPVQFIWSITHGESLLKSL